MKDERPVILITTVDIGGGKSDKIEIKKGDDPAHAAQDFIDRHGLPATILGPLTQHILENLRKAGKTLDGKVSTTPCGRHNEPTQVLLSGLLSTQGMDDPASVESSPAPAPAPMPTESPLMTESKNDGKPSDDYYEQTSACPPAQGNSRANGKPPQQQLSFANGMNDKLYEQLSAKLMPVNDSQLLTVNSLGSKGGRAGSSMSLAGGFRRNSKSADPSPRDSVHLRLYSNAIDKQHRLEERRKLAAAEQVDSVVRSRRSISWISQEMMKERTHGPFENYGEMLYAEGLEQAAMRKSKVGWMDSTMPDHYSLFTSRTVG